MIRSSFGRNSSSYNRATPKALLLCAMALGLGVVVHAQPFPSFLLDTARYIGRDLGVQPNHSAAAASPRGGIVAWTNFNDHVFASRLTGSMDVVDTIPMDATGPWLLSYTAPAVACSDSGYAVAWRGFQATVSSYEWPWIALISNSGEVASRVALDTEVQVHSLGVAARSDRYVVVYDGWFPSSRSLDVRAVEVGLDGSILRRSLVARGEDSTPFVDSSVVAPGDAACLAVFEGPHSGTSDISARLIWPENPLADTQIIPIRRGAHAFGPRVAFDGENFWVGWREETTPYGETVAKVARVTQNGVVLDTGGIVVSSGVAGIDLAAANETLLVALGIEGDFVVGLRYDADAQLLDSTPVLLATNAHWPSSVAAAADTFLVVWSESADAFTWRAAGRRVTASGEVVDPESRDYAFSVNSHGTAELASDGENFLAVWTDVRAEPNYSPRFVGRRFDNHGRFLDAEPFTIGDPRTKPLRAVLTYGAGCYLLAWCEVPLDTEPTVTYATRISREGCVLDTVPIPLCCSTHLVNDLDVAFLRDSMFVVSLDDNNTVSTEVVRVMADGRVLDSTPVKIKVRWGSSMRNKRPGLASMGDTLVYACNLTDVSTKENWVAVGTYTPSLQQLDSVWWTRYPHPHFHADVACGNGRILAAQEPDLLVAPFFWVLDSALNRLDTAPMPVPSGVVGNFRRLAYEGANFLCVSKLRGGRFRDVRGYRMSPDGELLDMSTVPLVAFDSTYVIDDCALAADSLGHVGLAFFTYEPNGCRSNRARAAVFPRLTSGVASSYALADLKVLPVSPNPSTGIAWVLPTGTTKAPQTVTVRDIAGRVRTEVSFSPASADRGRAMLDLRRLPAGVYFLETAGERRSCKLVLARPGGAP